MEKVNGLTGLIGLGDKEVEDTEVAGQYVTGNPVQAESRSPSIRLLTEKDRQYRIMPRCN